MAPPHAPMLLRLATPATASTAAAAHCLRSAAPPSSWGPGGSLASPRLPPGFNSPPILLARLGSGSDLESPARPVRSGSDGSFVPESPPGPGDRSPGASGGRLCCPHSVAPGRGRPLRLPSVGGRIQVLLAPRRSVLRVLPRLLVAPRRPGKWLCRRTGGARCRIQVGIQLPCPGPSSPSGLLYAHSSGGMGWCASVAEERGILLGSAGIR